MDRFVMVSDVKNSLVERSAENFTKMCVANEHREWRLVIDYGRGQAFDNLVHQALDEWRKEFISEADMVHLVYGILNTLVWEDLEGSETYSNEYENLMAMWFDRR